MKEIKLTHGQVTRVDDSDFEELSKYTWYSHTDKHGRKFYARRSIQVGDKVKYVTMHRQLLGLTDPKIQGDHIDGDSLNNQRYNLRVATGQQNSQNQKKRSDCSSKYRGVSWSKQTERWYSQIFVNGKNKYLGYFSDEVEAAKAYNKAAIEYFGEFAKLNFLP